MVLFPRINLSSLIARFNPRSVCFSNPGDFISDCENVKTRLDSGAPDLYVKQLNNWRAVSCEAAKLLSEMLVKTRHKI